MKPILLTTDDWVQLWLPDGNGGRKLAEEGHSMSGRDMLEALGIEFEHHDFDSEWWRGHIERQAILERGGTLEEAVAASAAADPHPCDESW